jgi:dUTP pyrophosphatase
LHLKFKKLDENAVTPTYASEGDAGLDLCALEATVIAPGERALVKTGIAIELREGTVGLVCSRSGLAYKKGVFVLNAPGIIDSGYRNDVGVILQNSGSEDFVIEPGDRIAQLVVQEFVSVRLVEVEELGDSVRGQGGFGSTGVRSVVVEEEVVEEEVPATV